MSRYKALLSEQRGKLDLHPSDRIILQGKIDAVYDDAGIAALNMAMLQYYDTFISTYGDYCQSLNMNPNIIDGNNLAIKQPMSEARFQHAMTLLDSVYGTDISIYRKLLMVAAHRGSAAQVDKLVTDISSRLNKPPSQIWSMEICGEPPLIDEYIVCNYLEEHQYLSS